MIISSSGEGIEEFPPVIPNPKDVKNLEELIVRTLDKLPKGNAPLVGGVTRAIMNSR